MLKRSRFGSSLARFVVDNKEAFGIKTDFKKKRQYVSASDKLFKIEGALSGYLKKLKHDPNMNFEKD